MYDHDYTIIVKQFNIFTLEFFREYQDTYFLFKLLQNYVDVPDLLSLINFHVPGRLLRANRIDFLIQTKKADLNHRSCIYRMCNIADNNSTWFDICIWFFDI